MENDSSYEQQLKNAFMKNCLPQISSFITKHMINHRTSRLVDLLDYARHAEQHFKNKKKNKKGQVFVIDEETSVFLMDRTCRDKGCDRGRDSDRNRGRDNRSRDTWDNRDRGGTGRVGDGLCFKCGRPGHIARDC